MDQSQLGPRLISKPTDQSKPSSKPRIPKSSPDTYCNTTEPKPTHRPLRYKHALSALRSKPSLARQMAQSKQTLCRKASALFCRGQRDGRALPRNAHRSSVPEAAVVQRGFSLTADIGAQELAVAEHAGDEMGRGNRSENIESAYPCTSTKPTSTLPSAEERVQEAPMTAPSASPVASCMMTPASKIGMRESMFRRRASFRPLRHDPSIPLVYLDEGKEGVVDRRPQNLQRAGKLLSGAQPGSSHGFLSLESRGRSLATHAKPAFSSDTTSSAISPSPLISDAFDFALAQASTTHAPPNTNTSSLTTLLIHSDAIFLPSAMEAKTSSALPSSESTGRGKGYGNGTGSTTSQIAEILRAVQIERDGLAEQNLGLREALDRAEGEVGQLRFEIAGMKRGWLCQERLRRVVAGVGEFE